MSTVFILAAVALVLVLYTASRYTYDVEEGALKIRWRVLGLPFNKREIPASRIKEIRAFQARSDLFPGFEIWGTLLRGKASIIELDSGWLRKVYITPPNASELRERILANGPSLNG